MITHDAVRELLKERKAAEHVVRGGMEGLVDSWEATVKAAQKGYAGGLDDWRNDVDCRHLLHLALEVAHPAQRKSMKLRLDAADAKFWKACESSDVCVWGAAVAEREKWTGAKEWWYFLVPKKAGDVLAKDLARLAPRSAPGVAPASAPKSAPASLPKSAPRAATKPAPKSATEPKPKR